MLEDIAGHVSWLINAPGHIKLWHICITLGLAIGVAWVRHSSVIGYVILTPIIHGGITVLALRYIFIFITESGGAFGWFLVSLLAIAWELWAFKKWIVSLRHEKEQLIMNKDRKEDLEIEAPLKGNTPAIKGNTPAMLFGNILALIFIAVATLAGFVSLQASAVTFAAIAYFFYILTFFSNFLMTPPKDTPFCQLLRYEEVKAYRRYHLHFFAPFVAQTWSSLMNGLRFAGFIWGGLCFWNGLYWLGIASTAYFFVTGSEILKLNPWFYMGDHARKGNPVAIDQLSLIEIIQEKREVYNAEQED